MKEIGFPSYKQATIKTKITLFENEKEAGTGIISGTLTTDVYLNDKGKLFYNALMFVADGYSNNLFVGNWTRYKTNTRKKCNWDDYRIPQCDWQNGCDIGAGEFSISDKYLKNGLENYRLAWNSNPEKPEVVKARKKEEEHWWK